MLEGVMLLWFVLAALSVLFVAVDIRSTPEAAVMKWGFVLVTAYTGVIGAFLYVLGCREPLPGLHEQYTASRWRQALGSTMHCVAGDGVGIIAGALLAVAIGLGGVGEMVLEYVLGFAFGWSIFQALFMRDMVGGSYKRALSSTFVPELVSMNFLMAGMLPTMMALRRYVPNADDPATANFWFVMSMALLVGLCAAYPINGWLVANHLKHGMMTVRSAPAGGAHDEAHATRGMQHAAPAMSHAPAQAFMSEVSMSHAAMPAGETMPNTPTSPPHPSLAAMTLLSFAELAVGVAIAMAQPM